MATMATKAKVKAKAAKSKAKAKPQGKKGPAKKAKAVKAAKPEPVQNTHIFDLARPMKGGAEAIEVAKSWVDGKMVNPNTGRLTPAQLKASYLAHHHINEDGELLETDAPEVAPTLPAMYQPLIMDVAKDTNAKVIQTCQVTEGARKPAAWDEKLYGPWKNRLQITKLIRTCHKPDARKLVLDENDLVTVKIGGKDISIVVGGDESAIHSIAGSKSGCYGANIIKGKQSSFEDVKGLGRLVGFFRPDYSIDLLDDLTDPGMSIGWGPNMVCDWGHLTRDSKTMTYIQIRAMAVRYAGGDKDACKDVKFEQLADPIVGNAVSESELWDILPKAIKDKTTSSKAWYNLSSVQCRTSPHEIKPNGFFNMQTGVSPIPCFGDSLKEPIIRFVIAGKKSGRLGMGQVESRPEARERLGLNETPAPKTAAPKIPAPKTAAPKIPAPKTAAPKQPATAAAPVTKDTSDAKATDAKSETTGSKTTAAVTS